MIQIRITGTIPDLERFIEDIAADDDVIECSHIYPNRAPSKLGRVYVSYRY